MRARHITTRGQHHGDAIGLAAMFASEYYDLTGPEDRLNLSHLLLKLISHYKGRRS